MGTIALPNSHALLKEEMNLQEFQRNKSSNLVAKNSSNIDMAIPLLEMRRLWVGKVLMLIQNN